jgi:hypothetical protein
MSAVLFVSVFLLAIFPADPARSRHTGAARIAPKRATPAKKAAQKRINPLPKIVQNPALTCPKKHRGCPFGDQHKIRKEEEIKLFLQEPAGFCESVRFEKLEPSVCDPRSEEIVANANSDRTPEGYEKKEKLSLPLLRFTRTHSDLTDKLSQLHSGFKRQTIKIRRRHTILNDRQVSQLARLAIWHR